MSVSTIKLYSHSRPRVVFYISFLGVQSENPNLAIQELPGRVLVILFH